MLSCRVRNEKTWPGCGLVVRLVRRFIAANSGAIGSGGPLDQFGDHLGNYPTEEVLKASSATKAIIRYIYQVYESYFNIQNYKRSRTAFD